jgi:hypothetical protein
MRLNDRQFGDAGQHRDVLDQIHERSGVRFGGRHIELPGGRRFPIVNQHVEIIPNRHYSDPFIRAEGDVPSETGRLHRVRVFVAGRRIDEHGNTDPGGSHKINVWGTVEQNKDEQGRPILRELLHSNDASMAADEKSGPFDPHERHQIRAVGSVGELGDRLAEGMAEHYGPGASPLHPEMVAHNRTMLRYNAEKNRRGEITFSPTDGRDRSVYDPRTNTVRPETRNR